MNADLSVNDASRATPTFLPGLTLGQRRQVADALERIGSVPVGLLALVFIDADRAAAQAFSARFAVRAALRGERDATPRTDRVSTVISNEHRVSPTAAAFAHGCAVGLRLGRMFWPHTRRFKRWIHDDWLKLDENQRERVGRVIRALLRGEEPRHVPGPRPGSRQTTKATKATIEAELAAVRRWKREAGKLARSEGAR